MVVSPVGDVRFIQGTQGPDKLALVLPLAAEGEPMLVIRNAAQVVCVGRPGDHSKRGAALRDPVVVPDGALIIYGPNIEWVGPTRDLPPLPPDAEILDAAGKIVLPGFVDS